MAEPVTNGARIAAGAFINRVKKSNTQATSAIARIHPSSQHMFEGDHNQLSKVLEMCMDLFATAERPFYERTPKGVLEEPATTMVAMARVVEPARSTIRIKSKEPAGGQELVLRGKGSQGRK